MTLTTRARAVAWLLAGLVAAGPAGLAAGWTAASVGLTTVAEIRWSPDMWAGAIVLSALLAMALTRLLRGRPATHHVSAPASAPTAVAHSPQL